MFDKTKFDEMPKFEAFNYWFIRTQDDEFIWKHKESFLDPSADECNQMSEDDVPLEVQADFDKFKQRPEYLVGRPVDLNLQGASVNDPDYMVSMFEHLIAGTTFIKYLKSTHKDPDKSIGAVSRMLNWLRNTDFYTCPGSTRFHDAEPHGLIYHSLHVYNNMVDLKHLRKFQHAEYDSITLLSLCHDFTKIGNYELYMRNVKDEVTQHWEQVPSYRWKCNPYPFGHGVASMYMISQFFSLSVEELLAIRWHMGEYRVADAEGGELEAACEQYPLVRMIQFADQLACVKYGLI